MKQKEGKAEPGDALFQRANVLLAPVEAPFGELDAHGLDADVVNVVGLVKDDDGLPGQVLPGLLLCFLFALKGGRLC